MIENLMIAINTILPIIFLMGIGYWTTSSGLVQKRSFEDMNKFLFKVLMPVLLMVNMMNTNIQQSFQIELVLYAISVLLAYIICVCLFVKKFVKEDNKKGAIAQAMFRGNFVLLGLPIIQNLYPNQDIGVTTVLIAVVVPMLNILSVVVLQLFSAETLNLKNTFIQILKNPMIIGTLMGAIILISGITLPQPILKTLNYLQQTATPFSIIVLGGNFVFHSVASNGKYLFITLLGKLVLFPILMVGGAVALGFSGIELATLLVFSGSPVAVASYAMSVAAKQDGEIASQAIALSTVLCMVTLILWITVLKTCNLI